MLEEPIIPSTGEADGVDELEIEHSPVSQTGRTPLPFTNACCSFPTFLAALNLIETSSMTYHAQVP